MSKCPYCGDAIVSDRSNFCASCGRQIREIPPEDVPFIAPEEERYKPMQVEAVTVSLFYGGKLKMKKKVIDGYLKKFALLTKSCVYVEGTFQKEIKPKNVDAPEGCVFWKEGALNGVLIYFLCALEGDEHKISDMVLKRMAEGRNEDEATGSAHDYIEAALIVLDELGIHIPLPPMEENTL